MVADADSYLDVGEPATVLSGEPHQQSLCICLFRCLSIALCIWGKPLLLIAERYILHNATTWVPSLWFESPCRCWVSAFAQHKQMASSRRVLDMLSQYGGNTMLILPVLPPLTALLYGLKNFRVFFKPTQQQRGPLNIQINSRTRRLEKNPKYI